MSTTVTPYKESTANKKEQVATMFNNIAGSYDFLNHLLSFGIDILWRKKAIRLLKKKQPKAILDVATGTADFAIQMQSLHPEKVTGVDISEEMLKKGQEKVIAKKLSDKITLMQADSENLPFEQNSFDAITVGFGVRNFENLQKGMDNMLRVLKPGGQIAILEFSKPRRFPIKQLYRFYFLKVTPFLGKLFSKDNSAYTYLPESVDAFPDGNDFLKIMNNTGFTETKAIQLTFGIASIYLGTKIN